MLFDRYLAFRGSLIGYFKFRRPFSIYDMAKLNVLQVQYKDL
jgi:hypothetical protein